VVRASLGNQAADLEWSDTRPFYQRLGFTFLTFRRYLEEQHAAGQRVDIAAEPVSETAKDRVAAYLSYEHRNAKKSSTRAGAPSVSSCST